MKRALRVIAAASVGAVLLVATPVAVQQVDAASCIKIYEIYYDSPGTDDGSNKSRNGEWIRLYNPCAYGKSLSGWTIKDAVGHKYTFGSYTLKAYGYVKVHTGNGTNSSTDRYWGSGFYIWNNDADTAKLRNASGTLIRTCSYSGSNVYKYC